MPPTGFAIVCQRRWPRPARLGNLHLPDRLRAIRPSEQLLPNTRPSLHACRIYVMPIRIASGFESCGPLSLGTPPHTRLLSVRSELCLQLPSHDVSRRRSCCSARSSRESGPPEDLETISEPFPLVAGRHGCAVQQPCWFTNGHGCTRRSRGTRSEIVSYASKSRAMPGTPQKPEPRRGWRGSGS